VGGLQVRKALFCLAYLASLALPCWVFSLSIPGAPLPYLLSVFAGIASFVVFANQLILISRPPFLTKAFSAKAYLSLHAILPVLGIVLAVFHHYLKVGLSPGQAPSNPDSVTEALRLGTGYAEGTTQAALGTAALIGFIALAVVAAFLMANTVLARIGFVARFKAWLYKALRLNYKRMRAFHNLTVAGCLVIMVHVILASSADFSFNLAGALYLILWAALSLTLFVVYRVRGRKV
jgi:predicted ferric reductase